MTKSVKIPSFVERHGIVLFIWSLLLFLGWKRRSVSLLRGELKSNDDYMRLVQIRDWLDGQSWFDLHQYRLNPAEPLYSHWSRLSDVLIGGPIKILTPIFGQANAELIMAISYPSLLLLLFLYLVISLTYRISSAISVPLAAAFMAALSFSSLAQYEMGRLDHHGLQIIMAIACCLFVIKSAQRSHHAIWAGILCGVGLYVGIESAPYVAAACMAVTLFWVFNEADSETRLRRFGLALAATTLICLFISAPPERWLTPSCDALSVVYVILTLMVSLVLWGVSWFSKQLKTPLARLLTAGALGMMAIGITVLLYPGCAKGPYANLDPRLSELWLSNVAEAGYFHDVLISETFVGIAVMVIPVFALIGYGFYSRNTGDSIGVAPRTILLFILMTLFAGLVQFRLTSFASSLAIPFAAYLLASSFDWAEKFKNPVKRVMIRMAFIIVLAPITIPLIISLFIDNNTTNKKATDEAGGQKLACDTQPALAELTVLPSGIALTQIDLGAPVLKFTDHSVISAPYHRNASGILATFDSFAADVETARQTTLEVKADYLIACRDFAETGLMRRIKPDGLLVQLLDDKWPDWLEPVTLSSENQLIVFKVK